MAQLSIQLLGGLRVHRAEQPITHFRSLKSQALLAYLAVEASRPHTRAAIAGLLWPEQPEAHAQLNLRQSLFRLRKLLENEQTAIPFLQITPNILQFQPNSDYWLDTAAFTQLLAACTRHAQNSAGARVQNHRRQCRTCIECLAQAVDLYVGEFMQGIYIDDSPPLEEWLLLQREWFHHQVLDALYDLSIWQETQGDYARAYAYARRQIELDSLREEAHRQAMRALALDGKRSEALAQYEACQQILYNELGVQPTPETDMLVRQIERGEISTMRSNSALATLPTADGQTQIAAPRHNLPQLGATLIGRETETARLRAVLLDPTQRIVTLVGWGGVGKTRLAIAAAADVVGAFTDGVWFVGLVGVEARPHVVTTLAGALGFTFQGIGEPEQQLLDYLCNQEALLILDNFEQAMAAAALVQALIESAPRLKILVTSRERLNFQSEITLPITGLPTPPANSDQPALAQTFSSVQLFVKRAQHGPLGFVLDDETLPAIVEICQLVEGLPLGIELAASWTEHYTCAEIAQTLRQTLDFLNTSQRDLPTRHHSLRAVFDYSWQLLTHAEQQALAQMTVFRGSFGRAAAQAVTTATIPQLVALVNKSLVRVLAPGRYALHEVVRQFAAEQVAKPQPITEHTNVQARYARYYLQFVQQQTGLFGQHPHKAVAHILQELDNVRQAWHWGVAHQLIDELAQALPNLAHVYDLAGLYQEAVALWQLASEHWQVATPTEPKAVITLRAHLALEQARARAVIGHYAQAITCAELALAQAQRVGNSSLQAAALHQLGVARYRQGDQAAALPLLEKAVTFAQTTDAARLTADCLLSLGEVQMYQGAAAGWASFKEALALYQTIGDRRGEGAALNSLGLFAHMQSNFSQGKEFFEQALQIHRALGDRHNEAVTLNCLGNFYSKQANYTESDHYLRQTLQLVRDIGYRVGEMQALSGLGVNQMLQKQATAARAYFEQALPIARQSGYVRGEGVILNNLGNLASDEQAYARAEQCYRAALSVAQQSGDQYYACARLHNMGNMRRFQGEYVDAQRCYQEAVTIAAAIGDRWIEASARADLALACTFLCDDAQAGVHYTQSLILARAIGDRWCECKVLANMGWLAVVQHCDSSGLGMIDTAIELAQAAKEIGMTGSACAKQGFALLLLDQPAPAMVAFTRSIDLWQRAGNPVQIITAWAGLAAAYLALGQPHDARNQVEVILQQMGDRPLGVADDPLRVYTICYQVLHATQDPRAAAFGQRARQHMAQQASYLTDPDQRGRFVARYTADLPT